MNRRGFLTTLGLMPAVALVDKKHFWTRLIEWFSPKPKPPQYVFTDWVAPEALRLLKRNLEFADSAWKKLEAERDRDLKMFEVDFDFGDPMPRVLEMERTLG